MEWGKDYREVLFVCTISEMTALFQTNLLCEIYESYSM